jgi:hypothetical protein
MLQKLLPISLLFLITNVILAQNTVGTTLNTSGSLEGYTLITPTVNTLPSSTYLIDNCGKIVNEWASNYKGQGSDTIMEDGSLFRGSFDNQSTLSYPGNNGRLEQFDWDGNLLWGYTYSATDYSFHHDYHILANGNILMLVAERKTLAEAIQAGRDPATIADSELYTEKVIEIQPIGTNSATVVWEWDLWDHLIQDFDNTKDNFGVVTDHPRALNVNYVGLSNNIGDWTHTNAIDYHEDFDQIVISSRYMGEFYIIDHSTTTAEAATDTGGNSGLGGSFLYRWGNPQAYDRGTSADQVFYGQHTVHWIPDGMPNAGKIMVFNNGFTQNASSVEFVEPPVDGLGNYTLTAGQAFGPSNAIIRYQEPTPTDFYAPFLSGAYQLSNGNILVDNGPVGELKELDATNQVVWSYVSPVIIPGTILSQGDVAPGINARFFRARRYEASYAGFSGRDLTPGVEIEQNPIPGNCALLSISDIGNQSKITLFPNPVRDVLYITNHNDIEQIEVSDISGKSILSIAKPTNEINTSSLQSGLYLVKISSAKGLSTVKIIKH